MSSIGKNGKTGLIFFPAFDWAISPTHPEREERLLYTRDQIFEEGLMDLPQIEEYKPRLAEPKDVARTHFCVPDVESQVTQAHLIAAGSTLTLADALEKGEIRNGFALVRPPGHHAMRVVHGNRGFCNINNMAIMVDYLRTKYGHKRIAVIDTDVHHGDGTQEIFWHDPDVLCLSFHQDGHTLYPGSGFVNEMGGPQALARTLNVPLPPGTTDEGIHYVLDNLILPILDEFKPDLVLNSAGQDNHYTDPLANMRFSANGYARLNEKLAPDICVLEGGYAVETALPYVNTGIIQAMAGLDYSHVKEPDYVPGRFVQTDQMKREIETTVAQVQKIWDERDELVKDALAGARRLLPQEEAHLLRHGHDQREPGGGRQALPELRRLHDHLHPGPARLRHPEQRLLRLHSPLCMLLMPGGCQGGVRGARGRPPDRLCADAGQGPGQVQVPQQHDPHAEGLLSQEWSLKWSGKPFRLSAPPSVLFFIALPKCNATANHSRSSSFLGLKIT